MTRIQRSRRRWLIAGSVLVAIVISIASIVFVRARAAEHDLTDARNEGMVAYEQGDYDTAVRRLGRYLSRNEDDVEALVSFADARSRTATDDYRHISEPIVLYNAALEKDPSNTFALEGLLLLYERSGRRMEWMETAERLLAIDPDHVDALRLLATGHAVESEFPKAEGYTNRLIQLDPDNIDWKLFYLGILFSRHIPLEDILDQCNVWLEEYEGDGRYYMLKANVLASAGQQERARSTVRQGVRKGASHEDVLRQFVSLLDVLQMPEEADAFIEITLEQYPEEFWPYEALVKRQWQRGRIQGALSTIHDLKSERGELPSSLLRWESLLYILRQQFDDAEAVLQKLADRTDADGETRDSIRAWLEAASARMSIDEKEWADVLSAYRTAIALDPQNGILHFLIGEAYFEVGEFELAALALDRAVRYDPHWIAANTLYIEALIRSGRSHEAAQIAASLLQRNEQSDLRLHLQFVRAVFGSRLSDEEIGFIERSTGEQARVSAYLEMIHGHYPDDAEVNDLLVAAYLREGRRERAIEHIRNMVERGHPDAEMILAFARRSDQHQLGQEQWLVDLARERVGLTIDVAETQARILHRRGRTEDGLALLREHEELIRQDVGDSEARLTKAERAERAVIHYLTWTDHREAAPSLRKYLLANPSVERAFVVLNQRIAWDDKELSDRAIKILEEFVGESSPRAVIARARHTSQFAADDDAAMAHAMKHLNSVLQQAPHSVEARTLMAALHLASEPPRPDVAIRHLQEAIAAQPERAELYPQLIGLLQQEGDFTAAERYLAEMSSVAGNDANLLRAQIELYDYQADYESIIARLSGHQGTQAAEADRLALFRALRRTGQNEQAESVLQDLMNATDPSNAVFAAATDFYISIGRSEDALRMIKDRLLDERPGVGAWLLGRVYNELGSMDDAEAWFQLAVEHVPESAMAWNQLATHYLERGLLDEARDAAERGLVELGSHETLETTLAVINLNLGGESRSQGLQLLEQFGDDREIVVRMLRLFDQLKSRPEGSPPTVRDLANLREFVHEHSDFLPAWRLAITAHAEAGELHVAHQLAIEAIGRFPNQSAPAELGSRVLVSMGDLRGARDMARIWRQRALDRPLDADMMLAMIALDLGDAADAAQRLEPHVQHIIVQRDRDPEYLGIVFRALLRSEQYTRAAELVASLHDDNRRWLDSWFEIVRTMSPHRAVNALTALEDALPKSPALQVRVAREWGVLASRTRSPHVFSRSEELAKELVRSGGDVEQAARLLLGSLAEQQSDHRRAKEEYRAVLATDGESWEAMVGLSRTILKTGGSKTEAYDLSRRALERQPDDIRTMEAHVYALLALEEADKAMALLAPLANSFVEARRESPVGLQLWMHVLALNDQWVQIQDIIRRLSADDRWPHWLLALSRELPGDAASMFLNAVTDELASTPHSKLAIGGEWAMLGERLGKDEHLNRAQGIANDLFENHPEVRVQSLLLQASAHERMYNDEAAAEQYREVLRLQQDNWIALNNLAAITLRTHGSIDEALELSASALRANPNVPELMNTRSRALLAAEQLDEATKYVEMALSVHPTNPAFMLTLAEIAHASKRFSEAREWFEEAQRQADGHSDRLLAQQIYRTKNRIEGNE